MGCCVSNEENEPVGLAIIQDLQLGSKKKDRQDYQFLGDGAGAEVGSKGGFARDCGENDGGQHCTPVSGQTHFGNVHSSGHGVSSHGGIVMLFLMEEALEVDAEVVAAAAVAVEDDKFNKYSYAT
ncbi:unnamed protein product [Moneuplotes crassus]|uniref:Uncharacterized protein n=1 Tax=Euplotes crassus TaxID=5936 RepID=A0AAD1Y3Y4_EUPCR|nr:unnamed protein product [Moneuplotes crassus]